MSTAHSANSEERLSLRVGRGVKGLGFGVSLASIESALFAVPATNAPSTFVRRVEQSATGNRYSASSCDLPLYTKASITGIGFWGVS